MTATPINSFTSDLEKLLPVLKKLVGPYDHMVVIDHEEVFPGEWDAELHFISGSGTMVVEFQLIEGNVENLKQWRVSIPSTTEPLPTVS